MAELTSKITQTQDDIGIVILALYYVNHEMLGGIPASELYIRLNSDMQRWETVKHFLTKTEFISISNHLVKLTEVGKTFAEMIVKSLQNSSFIKAKGVF